MDEEHIYVARYVLSFFVSVAIVLIKRQYFQLFGNGYEEIQAFLTNFGELLKLTNDITKDWDE